MSQAKAVVSLLLFVCAFAFYTHNAAPSVTAGDSGEFITGAATLSLPHSPSFPLYVMSARCFVSAIPFGSVAYRCNVFSAFTSAFTLVFLFLIACSAPLVGGVGGGGASSLVVVLLLALSGSFWENSLVTEVFSLNTLMAAAVTFSLLKINENRRAALWLATFLLGLGVGNHQVLLFVAPLFAGVAWFERRWMLDRSVITGAALGFLLGFSIYLVLPIRSQAQPPLNWGHPTTVSRLTHTILRKDYGTMTLALGEKPDRSLANGTRHITFFARRLAREISWPVFVIGFAALMWGAWKRDRFSLLMLVGFVVSGPFFIWLGNLPLTAQSDGIIGRFLIMPVFFLVAGLIPLVRQFKFAVVVLAVFVLFKAGSNGALAADHRNGLLVLDYGRAMLQSLPNKAVLFMDGGDDAFYSLAMLQNVMGKRPDVELHDRGGLVFPNPYGDDFRALPKADKPARREQVEKLCLQQQPVFYVTMDPHVLPGVDTFLNGIVVQSTPISQSLWPFYALRSLYPPRPETYRMLALAAFFPFAYAHSLQEAGLWSASLNAYTRAWQMGKDVDWLQSNLSYELSLWGYKELVAGHLDIADAVYRKWIQIEPRNLQAHSNWGVVLEKMGRLQDAREQYERTAKLFPSAADPVYNLSVLAWNRGDWKEVVSDLQEVLRRNPQHPQALGYLIKAQQKLSGKNP